MKKPLAGFTIVELVVVIAVIGILAAVTIVSYRGVQTEAHDTAIKKASNDMADAIQLWSTRTNKAPGVELYRTYNNTATRSTGFAQSGVYAEGTPEDTLIAAGYLPPNFSKGLSSSSAILSGNPTRILMFYPCPGASGRNAIYASLNNNSNQAAERTKAEAAGCTRTEPWANNMNYVVIF